MQTGPESAIYLRLKRVPMFAHVEEPVLRAMAAHCRKVDYAPTVHLFHEGAEAPGLYVILSGEIAIQHVLRNGDILVIATRQAGDVIGEISLLDEGPASATAVAVTAVTVAILRPWEFRRILMESPNTAMALLKAMAQRLRQTTDRLVSDHQDSLKQRLIAMLTSEADADGCVRLGNQREIGARLGASREAVNRTLRELVDRETIIKGNARNEFRLNPQRLSTLKPR